MTNTPRFIEDQLRSAGLPPEAGQVMLAAVRSAGYDAESPGEQEMGLAALTAALQVHEAALRASVRLQGRAGRNDPCPCGSGRKFKKCCQGKPVAEVPETGDVPYPLDTPDLIPQMHRAESFAADMENLDRLFEEDPHLLEVRFDGPELLAFVAEDLEAEEEAGEGEAGQEPEQHVGAEALSADDPESGEPHRLEQWASRYLAEVEGPEALGNVEDALLEAAPRWVQNPSDLRALALGVVLAGLGDEGAEEEGAPPNPLHFLIFQRTLREALEAIDAWEP